MNENMLFKVLSYDEFSVLVQNACGPKHAPFIEFSLAKDEKNLSVIIYRQLALKYTLGKKVNHIEIEKDAVHEPDKITPDFKTASAGNYEIYRFYIDERFCWDEFAAVAAGICDYCKKNATVETFGCCAFYIDCSDARECVHWDQWDYLGCYYRKNLESGRIFYGKNKNFSPDDQQEGSEAAL